MFACLVHARSLILTRLLYLGGLLVLAACLPADASPSPSPSLTVVAASDLIPAFTEIGEAYTAQTGQQVVFSFGSTGQAVQQIMEGAPVDVFAAANLEYIRELEAAGRVIPDSITLYGRGSITLWTPADSPLRLQTLDDLLQPGVQRIAIANPEHAPYGVAARQALQAAGLWDRLQSKLVFGNNISQTLQLAESGSVDCAIMAYSLSLASEGRWVLIPQSYYQPLDQAMAIVVDTPLPEQARRFVSFVNGPDGQAIMRRYGFSPPTSER